MGVASPLSGNISDQQQLYDYLVRSVMAAMLCSCLSAAEVTVFGESSANSDNIATDHCHRLTSCTGIKAGWRSRVGVEVVGVVVGGSTIENLHGRWTGAAEAASM